ncbi:MAG TPA: phage terminase large subunit [Xanthobacteraceae bacterium]|nr:phage terminase large subunit [Xanthobacteraceae bacterium]
MPDDANPPVVVPRASQFRFTPRQQEAKRLLQTQRHTLLVGGSRSGKTTLLVHEIAERALRAKNSRHAILRLHANAARASVALDTLPKIFRLAFPGRRLKRHRAEGYFSLENGSEIWIGGLGDQDQVEKILGKEYSTILLNEVSQIPYASVLVALTRLAQVVEGLRQAAYYDLNPTNKGHWTNILFGEKRDPISRTPLADPEHYARMFLNPGDNAENLSAEYLDSLRNLPERQRKRFFEGAYIDDLDGALFNYESIARGRVAEFALERRRRVVVAVDPSGAAGRDDERADEIGIVVAARGDDGHAYVLADRSLRDGPAAWGRAAVQAYNEFAADRIVAEENFGGEMVRFVIRAANPHAPVQVISASRGKALRAEPVSALYEQGLVHHVGRFAVLEDQLCAFTTQGYRGEGSPDHADADHPRSRPPPRAADRHYIFARVRHKTKARITNADRHKRFLDMAREVGASDDAKAFDKAFWKVVKPPKKSKAAKG